MWKDRCWNGRAHASGVEVLRYRITLPAWEEFEAVSSFYGSVAERCLRFCEETLRRGAEADFEGSEDSQKRFRFPVLRYTLSGRVTYEDTERGIASVLLTAELKRGADERLRRHVEAHTWDLREGLLLPPEQTVALRDQSVRLPRRARRGDGVFFDGERTFFVGDGLCRELILSKGASRRGFFKKIGKTEGKDGKNT